MSPEPDGARALHITRGTGHQGQTFRGSYILTTGGIKLGNGTQLLDTRCTIFVGHLRTSPGPSNSHTQNHVRQYRNGQEWQCLPRLPALAGCQALLLTTDIPFVSSFRLLSSFATMGGAAQREAIISSKHSARDKALALAPAYDTIHDPFLRATGRTSTDSVSPEQPDDLTFFFFLSATEIVENIAAGKWTASQVLDAYMARAVVSQAKTNCVTEGLFDASISCLRC